MERKRKTVMTATSLFRIAAVLLLLFALGHTVGFLKFRPPTPAGETVRQGMDDVHFQVRGKTYSYGGFYVGFGLFNTLFLVFGSVLAWHLGSLASRAPQAIGPIGWALCMVMVGSLVLCWVWFNNIAVAFSAVLVILLGWASWLVRGAKL
jgi:hypothetical protein